MLKCTHERPAGLRLWVAWMEGQHGRLNLTLQGKAGYSSIIKKKERRLRIKELVK